MKPDILKTIRNFRGNLQLLMEDIELEKNHTLAFYFDTEHLQRAAVGYKDYYYDDDLEAFKTDVFSDDTTLVCSLLSGGFIGQFRLLPPHQNEFLRKINSNFDGTNSDGWTNEVRTFVEDAEFELNVDEFVRKFQNESDDDLIKKITAEHTEATKKAFNVSHCLLPWDRRLAGWERKKLLVIESDSPDYDAIFLSEDFHNLKEAMTVHRKHDVSNFIDAAALTILIDLTRQFRLKNSPLVPRFFIPGASYNTLHAALKDTGLISELRYSIDNRESSVIRHEEYFFYRSFFRKQTRTAKTEWGVTQIKELYEKTSAILDRYKSIETLEFDDKNLQEIIDGMENYSFLKNVWIEFINSGDLRNILRNLEDIKKHFEEAKKSYDDTFVDQVKDALKATRENIFENLDVVQKAGLLWDGIHKRVSELRESISKKNPDGDALFRNRKLFRYGFPEELHKQIKEYLVLLLSQETQAEPTRRVIGKLVNLYRKAETLGEREDQNNLILITAVFCALDLRDKLKKLPERLKRRANLHYSIKIALAGAELDSNNYKKGMELIEELEKLYYKDSTTAAVQCDLAIALTYLHYYAWLALKRMSEREQAISEDPKLSQKINSQIHNAIVFADRATSLVARKPLAQRIYVYNQYLFCMVESENSEHNKKMRNLASKLISYRGQPDVWSYMYSDTLSHYFFWRAMHETDRDQKGVFMDEAFALIGEAMTLAPDDAEISAYHTKLVNEMDTVEVGS